MEQLHSLVLIDRNVLGRDCLSRVLRSFKSIEVVASVASIAEWVSMAAMQADVAVFVQRGDTPSAATLQREIDRFRALAETTPIIMVSDDEDPNAILRSLDSGCRGYIPSSFGVDVAFEAIRLVAAGGIFVPANSLLAYRRSMLRNTEIPAPHMSPFTARQEAVVQLIRQGMSNKKIASELNMRESTVKVHIRNIMKTIKAKNRTEIAVRTTRMSDGNGSEDN